MGLSVGNVFLKLGLRSGTDQASVDTITLFVTLLCACILIGHLLERNRWMNESITALAIGLCAGIVLLLTTDGKSSRILVPGEKDTTFRNFITIMLFGAVGTVVSFTIIALGSSLLFQKLDIDFLDAADYLAPGAIFSATDSVCTLQVLNQEETPVLYSLVFREGVINDATSVVLFNSISRFDLTHITSSVAMQLLGSFSYLFMCLFGSLGWVPNLAFPD